MAKTEYLKTDEAKQFAEQQAAAAECEEVESDEDEEPSADASSSTAKRKRKAPKQSLLPKKQRLAVRGRAVQSIAADALALFV